MGSKRIEGQVGVRYGRLVVTADPGPGGRRLVTAVCDCGGTVEGLQLGNLRNEHTISCGCHRTEVGRTLAGRRARDGGHRHDGNDTPLHRSWGSMRARTNGRKPGYENVKCDPRWSTFEGFRDNPPTTGRTFAPGLVLARFNDTGDYSPENTRWATKSENALELIARRPSEVHARFQAAAQTPEARGKRRASLAGKNRGPKPKSPCPVCGVVASAPMLARWHKHLPNQQSTSRKPV